LTEDIKRKGQPHVKSKKLNLRRYSRGSGSSRLSPKLILKSLGPGVITGASDDDPSGIATFSCLLTPVRKELHLSKPILQDYLLQVLRKSCSISIMIDYVISIYLI
jgi:hypothetical protein